MPEPYPMVVDGTSTEAPRISPFEIEATAPALNFVGIVVHTGDENCRLPSYDPWASIDFEEIVKMAFAGHR